MRPQLMGRSRKAGDAGQTNTITFPPRRDYTIISLTKHKFVLQDNAGGRHIGIWTK